MPHNLQQRWPEAERAWLRKKAEDLMVNETTLLLALVRREAHGDEGQGRPIDDYFPPAPPRSKRWRAARLTRATETDSV